MMEDWMLILGMSGGILAACLIFVLLIFVTSIYDEERLAYLRSTQPLFLDRQAFDSFDDAVPVSPAARLETCTICLDEIQQGQPCRELGCKHAFHADCLHAWWERCARSKSSCSSHINQVICPSCRQVQVFGRCHNDMDMLETNA
ncbi:unnamed protein product [Durusdinium trenchii]|uniref:RING-type domain-containing protein n=1 Tax=Durusdinium trenchii TaxID=1381693 RepID=A0ABP0LD94_9DINO